MSAVETRPALGMEVHRGTRGYTVIHGKSLSEQPNTRGYTVIHGASASPHVRHTSDASLVFSSSSRIPSDLNAQACQAALSIRGPGRGYCVT